MEALKQSVDKRAVTAVSLGTAIIFMYVAMGTAAVPVAWSYAMVTLLAFTHWAAALQLRRDLRNLLLRLGLIDIAIVVAGLHLSQLLGFAHACLSLQ